MLHGAASRAEDVSVLLEGLAERLGVILLAPNSRGYTWDVLLGRYGPDVAAIDRVLAWTFSTYAIDPARVAIGGFSDGASYALSLGLTNGDLFSHVLAFSPGFAAPARRVCSPRVFVSHGTRDAVLPIDRCSRRIVPALQRAGYDVAYREFDGGHTVPPEVVDDAANWFTTEGG
jgi:phospholipase/carboxylesterase